jgi:hypothetical protein
VTGKQHAKLVKGRCQQPLLQVDTVLGHEA